MRKSNKHIEIVRSATEGFSSLSQRSAEAILAVLGEHYTYPRITIINNRADLEALVGRQPDLVFMGMERIPLDLTFGPSGANRIWVAQYLDEHGIAYTGSAKDAHQLGRDKTLAKQRVLDAGLATSPFYATRQGQSSNTIATLLSFPLFVKPTDRGGGQGIDGSSVVYTMVELHAKIHAITTTLQADSLIEEYLPGREFSVAILRKEHSTGYDVMPIELVAPADSGGQRILGSEVKSLNTEQALGVADMVIGSRVAELALQVFHALGGRDYGRIDIRLDAAGAPHFLEANLIPSLIRSYGSFPKACVLNIGLSYESMILRITNLGLVRAIQSRDDLRELDTEHNRVAQLADVGPTLWRAVIANREPFGIS